MDVVDGLQQYKQAYLFKQDQTARQRRCSSLNLSQAESLWEMSDWCNQKDCRIFTYGFHVDGRLAVAVAKAG